MPTTAFQSDNNILGVAMRIVKRGFLSFGFAVLVSCTALASPRVNLSGISDEQTIAMYEQELAARPNDLKLLLDFTTFQMAARQEESARKTAERAVALAPTDLESILRLGTLLLHLGSTDAAIVQHERAIKLKPDFADAHFNLAVIYATSQPPNFPLSRKYYARALELGSEPDPAMEKLLK